MNESISWDVIDCIQIDCKYDWINEYNEWVLLIRDEYLMSWNVWDEFDIDSFALSADRFQAQGIPGAVSYCHHGESGKPEEWGGSASRRD